jgi:hypothetical protein
MPWLDTLLNKLQTLGPIAVIALLALSVVAIAWKSLGLAELVVRGRKPRD